MVGKKTRHLMISIPSKTELRLLPSPYCLCGLSVSTCERTMKTPVTLEMEMECISTGHQVKQISDANRNKKLGKYEEF